MKRNVFWGLILHKVSIACLNNNLFPNTLLNNYYFQVVRIDFALNHLIKLKYFVTADSAQANICRIVF